MSSNIDIIKESLDIVEIAGSLTHLRRSGKSMTGCCPFHGEKTPSFYIYPQNNRFKCFGCGASGSVIDLFAFSEEIPFSDAVKRLEESLGLERNIPKKLPKITSEQFKELGLLPKDMRELYLDDEELYRSIVEGKIQERMGRWQHMTTLTDAPFLLVIMEEKIGYYRQLQEAI